MFTAAQRQEWKQVTPYLWYCIVIYSMGDLILGIDGSSFGSLQALPSFLNTFGEEVDGEMVLSTYRKSIMNSIVFVGLFVGILLFEPIAARYGYRPILVGIAVLQIAAITIELTARHWIQFTVGRILAFVTMGLIEATIPTYSAEIAPPALRGFFSGLVTPLNTIASVWGASMSQRYATEIHKKGWMIPVAVQMTPAIIVLAGFWWTVESPRWLVAAGHHDQAVSVLRRLRPKQDADAGILTLEVEALAQAIEYDKTVKQGTWMDMLRGTMWRRSVHCSLFFFFYQVTGNQFYNSYGPTFFVEAGLGPKSFTYAIVVQVVGMVGAWLALILTDRTGRRPLHIVGSAGLILFDFLIASMGLKQNRTTAQNNTIVASFVLMIFSTKFSWATHCYLMTAEMGGVSMRKKIMFFGIGSDVLWSFVVSFSTPYIMDRIGAGIGYIFGGSAVIALLYAILFLPELSGRGLEEVDELFESPRHRWGWQFKNAKTSGVGATIAQLEMGHRQQVHKLDGAIGSDAADVKAHDAEHEEVV